jgi:hypothetical protein
VDAPTNAAITKAFSISSTDRDDKGGDGRDGGDGVGAEVDSWYTIYPASNHDARGQGLLLVVWNYLGACVCYKELWLCLEGS